MFLSCWLPWGQIMVDVMKTSFKRSHAGTAVLSAYYPAAGHCWSMPPPETPRHPWASLGQSLVGSLLLSPGSWCTQVFLLCVCVYVPSRCLFPQSYVSSGSTMVGLMATSSKRAYAIPRSAAIRAPALVEGHCWTILPQETLIHSKWCHQLNAT